MSIAVIVVALALISCKGVDIDTGDESKSTRTTVQSIKDARLPTRPLVQPRDPEPNAGSDATAEPDAEEAAKRRPPTRNECEAAFDRRVELLIEETRRRWRKIGRRWTDEAEEEVDYAARGTEISVVARCVRRLTPEVARCQAAAKSGNAWANCERKTR